jgi:alkylated DNA nucleotide flippase Atl1
MNEKSKLGQVRKIVGFGSPSRLVGSTLKRLPPKKPGGG